jgi:hypothetical protein
MIWRGKLPMSTKCYRRGRQVNTAMNTITNCHPPNKQIRTAVQKLPTIPIISMASWHCVGGCTGEGSWPNCLITSMVMIGREPPHYVARCWCIAHNGTCITSEQKRHNSLHLIANRRQSADTRVIGYREYWRSGVWACFEPITVLSPNGYGPQFISLCSETARLA